MECLKELKNGQITSHILPFLWMKGEDNATIRRELDRIEECGIREICLESRPHPDFCGPGWWETMDFLLPEAKKRGMRLWILDDRKFPTGYANGGFERHPEKQKIYLAERHMDIMGPCRDSAVLYEKLLPEDAKLIGIFAFPKPDTETFDICPEGVIDLTGSCKDGFVFFDLPEGPYRLFVLFTTSTGGGRAPYMNLIDSESVRVLIDEVYEKHFEHYPQYFGNVIAGFFSDEPELGNVPGYPFDSGLGVRDIRLPWSKELEARLQNLWGEKFAASLPALWYGIGEETGKIRGEYMDQVTDLVYTCFSGQVGNWCADHKVEYIGHIIEDDNAHTRLACSIGHYFKEMRGEHMSGVDVVHHQIVPGFTGKIHKWIAGDADGEFFHFGLAKMGSSAAHIDPAKKDRALCEVFGNYGWGEGIGLMKWLTDHMLVRGINIFTPHAFAMRYPDSDCPPHFYAAGNNPEFDAFSELMKYMQRGAHLLTSGVPVMEAAVLYHAESEWSTKPYELFQKPVRELMEHQIDCDIVPAQVLSCRKQEGLTTAAVKDGKLVIGNKSYGCLVLPFAECLVRETAEFVIKAADEGLPVFTTGKAAGFDTKLQPLPEGFAAAVKEVSLKELAKEVSRVIKPKFSMEGEEKNLRVMELRNKEGRIFMFFNESVSERITKRLTFDGPEDTAVKCDLWTNTQEKFALEKGSLLLNLEPGEAVFFVLEKNSGEKALSRKKKKSEEILDIDWKVSRADELHYGEFEPIAEFHAGDHLPNMNGPAFDPCFTGFYRYEGSFFCEKKEEERVRLKLPAGGDAAKVRINGKNLGYLPSFPGSLDVTEALKNGTNDITLEFVTTLVWKRKDGASTHLQLYGTGLLACPVLVYYDIQ